MRRRSSALFAVAAATLFATSLQAHFVYLVPAKDNRSIQVVFSENLEPDSEVPIQRIAGIKLSAQAKENQTVQLQHQTAKDFLKADLPENIQVVRG